MASKEIDGVPVSDQTIGEWADEAERGYPVERLRKRGRKTVGDGPGTVVPVRMDAQLLAELTELAERKHVSRSEVIRDAVRRAVAAS